MKTIRLTDYEDHYQEISKVIYQPELKRTTVKLRSGHHGVATLTKDDEYNEAAGFWCAYAKAMRKLSQAILEDNVNLKNKIQAEAFKKYGIKDAK